MLGGHLDSWHSGTGATDNAAGVAVAMEAARILRAAGLRPRRTVRVALWSGEEQGTLGSRGYVKEHFGGVVDAPGRKIGPRPGCEAFSAYFNLDNGTGRVRGVYLGGTKPSAPSSARGSSRST